jgi:hypothetical protein
LKTHGSRKIWDQPSTPNTTAVSQIPHNVNNTNSKKLYTFAYV